MGSLSIKKCSFTKIVSKDKKLRRVLKYKWSPVPIGYIDKLFGFINTVSNEMSEGRKSLHSVLIKSMSFYSTGKKALNISKNYISPLKNKSSLRKSVVVNFKKKRFKSNRYPSKEDGIKMREAEGITPKPLNTDGVSSVLIEEDAATRARNKKLRNAAAADEFFKILLSHGKKSAKEKNDVNSTLIKLGKSPRDERTERKTHGVRVSQIRKRKDKGDGIMNAIRLNLEMTRKDDGELFEGERVAEEEIAPKKRAIRKKGKRAASRSQNTSSVITINTKNGKLYSKSDAPKRRLILTNFTNSYLSNCNMYSVRGSNMLFFSLKDMKLHLRVDYHGASFINSFVNTDVSYYL